MVTVRTGSKLTVKVEFSGPRRDMDFAAILSAAYQVFGRMTCEVHLTPQDISATGMAINGEPGWQENAGKLAALAGSEFKSFEPHPAVS